RAARRPRSVVPALDPARRGARPRDPLRALLPRRRRATHSARRARRRPLPRSAWLPRRAHRPRENAAMTAARLVAVALLAWSSAAAAVERYAVIIGNNVGARDEVTLRYAEQDATRIYDVLKDLGGFHPEDMVLLKREEAATVRRALIAMNDRIRAGSA